MRSSEPPDHDVVGQWLLDWGEERDAVDEQLSWTWCQNGFDWQMARDGKWDWNCTATDGRGLQDAVALRHCHRLWIQHCPSWRRILQTCEEATWHAESHARLRDKSFGWAERWNAQCNTMWDPHLRGQQTSLRIDRPPSHILPWMDWRKTVGREAGQGRGKEETGGREECQTCGRGKEEGRWALLAVVIWTSSQTESYALQETSDSKRKGLGEIDPGTSGYSRAKRRNRLQWHASAKRGPHEWQLFCGIHDGRCCCGKCNEAQSLAAIPEKDHSLLLPGSWHSFQCDIARVGQCKRWGLAPLVYPQLQHDQHASLPLFLESGIDDDPHWPLQYPGDFQRHSGIGQETPMQIWNGIIEDPSAPDADQHLCGQIRAAPTVLITDMMYHTRSNQKRINNLESGLQNAMGNPGLKVFQPPWDHMYDADRTVGAFKDGLDYVKTAIAAGKNPFVIIWLSFTCMVREGTQILTGEAAFADDLINTMKEIQKVLRTPIFVAILGDAAFHGSKANLQATARQMYDELSKSGVLCTLELASFRRNARGHLWILDGNVHVGISISGHLERLGTWSGRLP